MLDTVKNRLGTVELFSLLGEEDLLELSKQCQWNQYQPNETVLEESDTSSDVFFITEGTVVAKSVSSNGKEVTYIQIEAGGIFGEFSAVDGAPRSAEVRTCDFATVARLSAAEFRQARLDYPQISLKLDELLVAKCRELTRRNFEISALPVRQRVQLEIMRLGFTNMVDGNRAIINPAPTHYDIATRIATHREAVSREMANLTRSGVITANRKRVVINDMSRLKTMIEATAEHA